MEITIQVVKSRTFKFALTEHEAQAIDEAFGPGSPEDIKPHGFCTNGCPICNIVRAIRGALHNDTWGIQGIPNR